MTSKTKKPKNKKDKQQRDEQGQATKPANPKAPTKAAPADNPGHETNYNPDQGNPSTRRNPEAGKQK